MGNDEEDEGIEVDVSVLSRIQNDVSDGDSDYDHVLSYHLRLSLIFLGYE